MDYFEEKLNKSKTEVKLTAERKQIIKERLLIAIAQSKNVRADVSVRQPWQRSLVNWLLKPLKPMQVFLVIAIIVMAGGGTSLAAENALPGNLLYPIKLKVNEEVRAAFSASAQAQAEWEAKRAERRVEEAVKLAAKTQINAQAEAQIEERFEAHAQRVKERITDLEAKGKVQSAIDLASKFEASLKAHEQVLVNINGGFSQAAKTQIQPMRIRVGSVLAGVSQVRERLETEAESQAEAGGKSQTETKSAAENKINAAGNVIAATRSVFENWKAKLGTQAVAQAETKLGEASGLQAQAKAKFDAGQYNEAFNLANKAVRIAQEARTMVEIQGKFNLQLRIDQGTTTSRSNSASVNNETEVKVGGSNNRVQGGNEIEIKIGL